MAPPGIIPKEVADLELDPQNPRLPEIVQGKSQSELLKHIFEHHVLEEIAQSYADNGFFPREPTFKQSDLFRPSGILSCRSLRNPHWFIQKREVA